MNSSHERGQGKCAFADEFQTPIKRCSSGVVRLQMKAIFGKNWRQCLHAQVFFMYGPVFMLVFFFILFNCLSVLYSFWSEVKWRARGKKKKKQTAWTQRMLHYWVYCYNRGLFTLHYGATLQLLGFLFGGEACPVIIVATGAQYILVVLCWKHNTQFKT